MAFATAQDIAGQWRPLTGREQTRATALLAIAEILIRAHVPDVDTNAGRLAVAKQVAIEMVADALGNGARRVAPAVTQASLDGAAYTASLPDGAGGEWVLTFTEDMARLFGLASARQPAFYFGDSPQ